MQNELRDGKSSRNSVLEEGPIIAEETITSDNDTISRNTKKVKPNRLVHLINLY